MSRLARVLLLICLHAGFSYGMECSYGSNQNILEKVFTSCPRPFTDPSDYSYCCYDIPNNRAYCCSAEEFAKTGLSIIIPVIIAAAVIIGLIVCCISCLCCSCCPWYRRRQGTVYGRLVTEVQTPVVQVIQPQANVPPNYTSQAAQNPYVPYPTNSTGMPQPPPYNEAYAKQAPYNPAYPPPQ
ncbi:hypothetical protein P5V15_012419 [Pogonomyrmex californicus]